MHTTQKLAQLIIVCLLVPAVPCFATAIGPENQMEAGGLLTGLHLSSWHWSERSVEYEDGQSQELYDDIGFNFVLGWRICPYATVRGEIFFHPNHIDREIGSQEEKGDGGVGLAGFVHYPFGDFLPYAGVALLHHDAPHDGDGVTPTTSFAPTVGLAWHFNPRMSACVEARWFSVDVTQADYIGDVTQVNSIQAMTIDIGIQFVVF